jgi:hypothetical protein
MTATAQADVAVYSGRVCLGAVTIRAGKHVAADAEGKRLGAFTTRKSALAAVSDAASKAKPTIH